MKGLRGANANASWRVEHGVVKRTQFRERVRLEPPRIRGSVLVKDSHGRTISYARGETKNADQPRTSHRTHPRDPNLRTPQLVHYFCADYVDVGDAVYGYASAMEFGATLDCWRGDEPAFFCLCAFPRTGAQHGGAHLQNTRDF